MFLASAGTVQAANELDGKALLCTSKSYYQPVYGLVFDKGKVSKWGMVGSSKKILYSVTYEFDGIKKVKWFYYPQLHYLNRQTLGVNFDQCSISSKAEIFKKLDETYAAEKKKNKI